MLGSDHDVFHARVFGDTYPLTRVKLHGIKLRRKLFVVGPRKFAPFHAPPADAVGPESFVLTRRNRVESPVNEHTEARFTPPTHPLVAFCFAFRSSDFACQVGLRKAGEWSNQKRKGTKADNRSGTHLSHL